MQKSIVFYADILGFSELVMESSEREKVLENIKASIKNSLRFFDAFNETVKNLGDKIPVDKVKYKLFSDNLYLSVKVLNEEDFDRSFLLAMVFARSYQESMLHHRYLIRGAISYDEDYNDDNIIFSPALIKAYNIESKSANYPRIVIDLEIMNRMVGSFSVPPQMLNLFNNSIIYDWAYTYFLNPVGIVKDYNPEGKDFMNRKFVDTKLRSELIKYLHATLRKLLEQNKRKEHEKVLWLLEVVTWLTAIEFTPDNVVNKLGLAFMNFQ